MNVEKLKIEELARDEEDGLRIARFIIEDRNKISDDIKVLELLAHTRFATAGQLCRVISEGNIKEKCQLIENLLRNNLINKIANIKIKYGKYKGILTIAYFLTSKGQKSLKFYFPKTAQYAKVGFPDKTTRLRVNHQLLVAEAYLHFHNNFKVLKCESEDQLQADFRIENAKRSKQGLKPHKSNGGFPDLKISYLYKEAKIITSSIEACVKLSQRQINRKSRRFEWFVYDTLTFSHVWRETGEHATMTDDVLSPIEAEQYFRPKEKTKKINEVEIKTVVMSFLRSIGGGATKNLIQNVTKLKETKLRTELDKMVAEKSLGKIETCLIPGVSRGRNINFYYLPNKSYEPDLLREQLVRAYATERVIAQGYTPNKVDACGVIFFRLNNNPSRGAVLLTDFISSPITGERIEIWNHKQIEDYEFWLEHLDDVPSRENIKYFYASTDLQRIFSTKELNLPNLETIDLSTIRQAQSYRYKAELYSETISRDNHRRLV